MTDDRHTTKHRLLDAAEELFGAKNFEHVSIRELAAAADVNVAAINYHFQNKENLFLEVIKRRFVKHRDKVLDALDDLLKETGGEPRLDQVIRTLVRHHLEGALAGPGKPSFMALVARHLQPGQVRMAGPFFQVMVAPIYQAFAASLNAARPSLEPGQVSWIAASVMGQIQHLIMRWHKRQDLEGDPDSLRIIHLAFPALDLPLDEYIDQVTDHITRFSTAAIDGMYPEVTT